MYCKFCGSELKEDMNFCQHCGNAKENVYQGQTAYQGQTTYQQYQPNMGILYDNNWNRQCIKGFILALLSVPFNIFGILGIIAVLQSYKGFVEAKVRWERGRVLACMGMLYGGVSIFIGVCVGIVAVCAVVFP